MVIIYHVLTWYAIAKIFYLGYTPGRGVLAGVEGLTPENIFSDFRPKNFSTIKETLVFIKYT